MSKTLFMHLPKTGGGSVVTAIDGIKRVGHNLRDPKYKFLCNYLGDSNDWFTVVRNPYDRLVSAYFYLNKGGNNPLDMHDASLYTMVYNNFEDFVMNGLEIAVEQKQLHLVPQMFFLQGLSPVDIRGNIIYYEYMESGLNDLVEQNEDLTWKCKLPKMNTSNHNAWQSYYTKDMLIKVNSIYNVDFSVFGYHSYEQIRGDSF